MLPISSVIGLVLDYYVHSAAYTLFVIRKELRFQTRKELTLLYGSFVQLAGTNGTPTVQKVDSRQAVHRHLQADRMSAVVTIRTAQTRARLQNVNIPELYQRVHMTVNIVIIGTMCENSEYCNHWHNV